MTARPAELLPWLLCLCLQRVEYFKGSKLVDALTGTRYKGKLAKGTPIKTRAEAAKLAQELLRVGFIHRSQRFQHAHSRRWELELFNGPFEEDGLFTWVYEGETSSRTRKQPSYAAAAPDARRPAGPGSPSQPCLSPQLAPPQLRVGDLSSGPVPLRTARRMCCSHSSRPVASCLLAPTLPSSSQARRPSCT